MESRVSVPGFPGVEFRGQSHNPGAEHAQPRNSKAPKNWGKIQIKVNLIDDFMLKIKEKAYPQPLKSPFPLKTDYLSQHSPSGYTLIAFMSPTGALFKLPGST